MTVSNYIPVRILIQKYFGISQHFKLYVYSYVYRTNSQYTAEHTFVIFMYNVSTGFYSYILRVKSTTDELRTLTYFQNWESNIIRNFHGRGEYSVRTHYGRTMNHLPTF